MMRTSFASLTSLSEMKRSMDWRKMLTPSANRKVPLKKAPRSRARCQPKEKSWRNSVFSEICRVLVETSRFAMDRETHNDGQQSDDKADQIVQLAFWALRQQMSMCQLRADSRVPN